MPYAYDMRTPGNWNALSGPPHGPGPKPVKPNAAPSPSERVDAQRELLRHAEEASLAKALQQSDEPRAEHRVRFRNGGTEDGRAQVALHRAPYWRQRRL